MKKAGWLAVGATLYLLAAWSVAPGFYDGLAPPSPYRFVSPPPQLAGVNQPPLSAHHTVSVRNGVVDPGAVFTGDGQAELSFVPGAFVAPTSGSAVTIDIKPESTYPPAPDLRFLTNVYLVTASTSLQKQALITLRYSDQLPAPSFIYVAAQDSNVWTSIGSTSSAAPFTISAQTRVLGYFAAGYAASATPPPSSPRISGQLPLLIALGIVIVIVATLPLAFMRRRTGDEES